MIDIIIAGALGLLVGVIFGMFIAALLAANDPYDEED